jgi:hypothetical protein
MRDLIYDHVGIKEALCPVLVQFGNLQPRDLRSDSNMIVIGRNLAFNAARETPPACHLSAVDGLTSYLMCMR